MIPNRVNTLTTIGRRRFPLLLSSLILLSLSAFTHRLLAQPLPNVYGVASGGGKLNGGTVITFAGPPRNFIDVPVNFGIPLIRPWARNVEGPGGFLYNFGYGGNQGKGGLFRVNPDGTGYEQVHDFGAYPADQDGTGNGSIAISADGVIYGSTDNGGAHHSGVVYRINADGTGYRKLADLPYATVGSPDPSTLVLGADGFLYGTHFVGSTFQGNIYKVAADGSGLTELLKFNEKQLINPKHLHWGSDGRLYGVARVYEFVKNVIFRLNTDGSNYEVVHTFDQAVNPGVIEASDGLLYGTSPGGGNDDRGYTYRCATDGSDFEIIHHFDTYAGAPIHGLREYTDGFLYGVASSGGTYGHGVVYRIQKDGSGFSVVHNLPIAGGKSELVINDRGIFLFTVNGGSEEKGTLYHIHDGFGEVARNFFEDNSMAFSTNAGLTRSDDNKMQALAHRTDVFSKTSLLVFSGYTGSLMSVTDKIDGNAGGGISAMVNGQDGYWYWINTLSGVPGTLMRAKVDDFTPERIYDFSHATGSSPFTDIYVHNGYVYGSCPFGGTAGNGVIYRVKTDGTGYQILRSTESSQSMPSLAIGPDERIYAADKDVFTMKLDGSDVRILHAIPIDQVVSAPLTVIGDQIFGVRYKRSSGTTFAGAVFNVGIDASNYRDIHTFGGSDGDSPFTALYPFLGRLYGATHRGGQHGWGTLFTIDLETGDFTAFKHLDHTTGYYVSMRLTGTCYGELAPTITVAGNTLTSSSAFGNQWFRNGVAITGAGRSRELPYHWRRRCTGSDRQARGNILCDDHLREGEDAAEAGVAIGY